MGASTKIGAWIRDPRNNLLKGMSKRSALFELFCQNPEDCDLLQKENTCLHCGAMTSCPFGSKRSSEGPTPRALSFHKTLAKWREDNSEYLNKLDSLKAYNRIFRANGKFYLPYSWMTNSGFGVSGAPLESEWVPADELTTELLGRICDARPMGWGGVIENYQKKEIPKFIADLKSHYPDVFDRLPEEHRSRIESISYVGRKAVLTTCAPGKYSIRSNTWDWDGAVLRGHSMLFQPVPGEIEITIKPDQKAVVEITDNSQVTDDTRFAD